MFGRATSLEPKSQFTINLALRRKQKRKELPNQKNQKKAQKERKFPIKEREEAKAQKERKFPIKDRKKTMRKGSDVENLHLPKKVQQVSQEKELWW